MLLQLVLFLIGLGLLVWGADALVKGASSLAKVLGIRSLVIGLTVVAFGTSAPEMVVNLLSAYSGETDIAIGNVIGSNIANILLILGICAAIVPLVVERTTAWKEIPFSLLAAVMVVILGSDVLLDGGAANVLTRSNGLVLLGFFIIFLYYTYGISKGSGESSAHVEVFPSHKTAFYILVGLAALVGGGKLIVDAAVSVAMAAGVSEHLIGITIVAVGTSLPELATSVVAARKGQAEIAVGNIVGSNIFNIFFILGTTATIAPLPFSANALQDSYVVMFVSTLLFFSMFVGQRFKLDRWQGVLFVAMYAGYVGWSVIRG